MTIARMSNNISLKRVRALAAMLVLALTVGAASTMGGCSLSGMLTGDSPAPKLFVLSPKSTFDSDLPYVKSQLVVETPVASEGLNTHRIALRESPLTLDYFAGARWTERVPLLVQTLLVESFENTNKIISVARQGIDLRADYVLKTELREFQAEYAGRSGAPDVWVRLNVKLVRMPARIIVASENFEARLPAGGATITDIVFAFDESLNKVLKKSVSWTMRRLE